MFSENHRVFHFYITLIYTNLWADISLTVFAKLRFQLAFYVKAPAAVALGAYYGLSLHFALLSGSSTRSASPHPTICFTFHPILAIIISLLSCDS